MTISKQSLTIVVGVLFLLLSGVGFFYVVNREKGEDDPLKRKIIEDAKVILAEKLNTAPKNLKLVSIEEVEWSDGSLGAPEEGMFYIQVIIPGYRLVFKHDRSLYQVHTDKQGKHLVFVKDGGWWFEVLE